MTDHTPMPPGTRHHGRIVSIPEEGRCLDLVQLDRLEQAFREWAAGSPRADVRAARRRILMVFLLIRYTGAKLNEVLALNPFEDIDPGRRVVVFRGEEAAREAHPREVQISETLSREIQAALADPFFTKAAKSPLDVDPGFVRRKFYDRAQACGFPKRLGGPEMIRKARAVELIRGNMPLPAVQQMMGHSTPNLTFSYVTFSPDDMRQVARVFIEREASRRTSARNSFFGKIHAIERGDIQTRVVLTTVGGHSVTTVITNDSVARLALKEGGLITAEVKAPWVILLRGKEAPASSAENRFSGVVERITEGKVNTEYTVRLTDGTAVCAVVSTESARCMALRPGEPVWAVFNCFAVVLHVE
ncbi:TOBE domain-containing protein [Desulfococcus sp.]|uniref:TOBE domain-containing protein n=1 Tax=Desulfococcus sp. TaxID=2025834 RepID=UPI0035943D3C